MQLMTYATLVSARAGTEHGENAPGAPGNETLGKDALAQGASARSESRVGQEGTSFADVLDQEAAKVMPDQDEILRVADAEEEPGNQAESDLPESAPELDVQDRPRKPHQQSEPEEATQVASLRNPADPALLQPEQTTDLTGVVKSAAVTPEAFPLKTPQQGPAQPKAQATEHASTPILVRTLTPAVIATRTDAAGTAEAPETAQLVRDDAASTGQNPAPLSPPAPMPHQINTLADVAPNPSPARSEKAALSTAHITFSPGQERAAIPAGPNPRSPAPAAQPVLRQTENSGTALRSTQSPKLRETNTSPLIPLVPQARSASTPISTTDVASVQTRQVPDAPGSSGLVNPPNADMTHAVPPRPFQPSSPVLTTQKDVTKVTAEQPETSPKAQTTSAPQPTVQTSVASVSVPALASSVQASVSAFTLPATDPAEEKLIPVAELRFSSEPGATLTRPALDASFLRAETPRHVAAQIAEAIQRNGANRGIELTLNPAELGRVKVSLQSAEGVMHVHVMADRGETLDLMRRHAEMLAEEFHAIGFGAAQFSFSQQSSGNSDADGDTDKTTDQRASEERSVPPQTADARKLPPTVGLTLSDRIDIRL